MMAETAGSEVPTAFPLGRALKLHLDLRDLVATALIVAVTAFAAFAATPDLGEVAAALIFMLGISLAGAFGGLAAALLAALVAFFLYNFYLTEPVLTFRLATGSDIAPLVVFNLCALVAGMLAGLLKDRAQAAHRSNMLLAGLLEASRSLQSAVRIEDVADSLHRGVKPRLPGRLALFGLRDEALFAIYPPAPGAAWRVFAEQALAADAASIADGPLAGYKLVGGGGPVGVLLIEESAGQRLEPAFVAALNSLIALALERAILSARIAETSALARTEELKTALLSSVSHDFRTPLTTIAASASSLISYREQLGPATSERLLHGIVEECDRLNRYTANLLEMSRIEAGQAVARGQTLDVAEMLGSVIARVRPRAGARTIRRDYGGEPLLVRADAALFELALVNVLDNAVTHGEDGTLIEVSSRAAQGGCEIVIADEGRGIPPEDLERVFERFYRVVRAEAAPRGTGLGLAIARGFVEAIGGHIAAVSPGIGDRGTRITIWLPLADLEDRI
jgi:two-component system sensor histidine kinase KdpD